MDFYKALNNDQKKKTDLENYAKSLIQGIANNYRHYQVGSSRKSIRMNGVTQVYIDVKKSKIEISISAFSFVNEKGADISGDRGTLRKEFTLDQKDNAIAFIAKTLAKDKFYPENYVAAF